MSETKQDTMMLPLEQLVHVLDDYLNVPIFIEVEGIVSLQLPIVIEHISSFERGIQLEIKNSKPVTLWNEEMEDITFNFDKDTIVFIEGKSTNVSFVKK